MPTSRSRCQFCGEHFRSSKSLHQHKIAKGHVTRTMEIPVVRKHLTETMMQTQKPEYSYSNTIIKAGQTMPEALLLKLIAENRTAIGCGIRTKSAMEKEIFETSKEGKTTEQTLAYLKRWMEGTKEFTRLVSFHSLPTEFDEDVEIQPWAPLKDSKGNPLLYVAIEGDFPKYIDGSADHYSESSRLLVEWLGPKIETIFQTSGNRPDRLFEYLNSDDFGRDFEEVVGHRGVLSFLPVTGAPFTIARSNELGVTGDWGTASVAYGYTESVTAAATPAKEEKKVTAKSKYVDDDTPAPIVKPDVAPGNGKPPAPGPLNPGQEMVEEEILVKPPKSMHGKTLKNWWRKSPVGDLPGNWRDDPHPGVLVKVKKPVAAAAAKTSETAIAAALKAAEVGKTMPILSGEKQKSAVDFVKKYVGDGSALIQDPATTSEEETKLAKFHQLMGWKDLSEISRYTPAFLAAFVREHPEAMWLYVIESRAEMRRMQKVITDLVSGKAKLSDLAGTEKPDITAVPESKPLTPSPEPEPKKVAGSKYL